MSFINPAHFCIYLRFLLYNNFLDYFFLYLHPFNHRLRPKLDNIFLKKWKLFLIVLNWQVNFLNWIVSHRIKLAQVLKQKTILAQYYQSFFKGNLKTKFDRKFTQIFYRTTLCLILRTFLLFLPLLQLHSLLRQSAFRYYRWSWFWYFFFNVIILKLRQVYPFCSQNNLCAIFWEFSFPWYFGRFLPLKLKKNNLFWLGVVPDLGRPYRFCHF